MFGGKVFTQFEVLTILLAAAAFVDRMTSHADLKWRDSRRLSQRQQLQLLVNAGGDFLPPAGQSHRRL